MKVKIVYPKNTILKKYIQYFLFIEKENFEKISQICYPNTNHCLSLMQNSKIQKLNESDYEILFSNKNTSYLTGIYKRPINISTSIPYKELCINFNPLGLELLFNEELSSFIFKNNVLNYMQGPNWNILFEIAFSSTTNFQKRQKEMESFFLYNINDKSIKHQNFNLNEIEHYTDINDIENKLFKSYRSTYRFFKNKLQITPKDFLLIKKVREGMALLFEEKSITEISYDLNFTDQSHFIKTLKRYTGLTPLQFKRETSTVNKTLIWNIQ